MKLYSIYSWGVLVLLLHNCLKVDMTDNSMNNMPMNGNTNGNTGSNVNGMPGMSGGMNSYWYGSQMMGELDYS